MRPQESGPSPAPLHFCLPGSRGRGALLSPAHTFHLHSSEEGRLQTGFIHPKEQGPVQAVPLGTICSCQFAAVSPAFLETLGIISEPVAYAVSPHGESMSALRVALMETSENLLGPCSVKAGGQAGAEPDLKQGYGHPAGMLCVPGDPKAHLEGLCAQVPRASCGPAAPLA